MSATAELLDATEVASFNDSEAIAALAGLGHALLGARGSRDVRDLATRFSWFSHRLPGTALGTLIERLGLSRTESLLWMIVAAPCFDDGLAHEYARATGGTVGGALPASFVADLAHPVFADVTAMDVVDPASPLVRFDLVAVDASRPSRPELTVPADLVRFVTGRWDTSRLASGARAIAAVRDWIPRHSEIATRIADVLAETPQRIAIVGGAGTGKTTLAARIADQLGTTLIELALAADPERAIRAAARESLLSGALLAIDLGADPPTAEAKAALAVLDDCAMPALVTSGTSLRAVSPALLEASTAALELPEQPAFIARAVRIHAAGNAHAADRLARPGLTPGDIDRAFTRVVADTRLIPSRDIDRELARAFDEQVSIGLAGVAERLAVTQTWDDLVLPAQVRARLGELAVTISHSAKVFGDWGFSRGGSAGRATTALFAGPSGTGKTMAAGVIARSLGRELYRIDVSQVVSKYIGETEKNLSRVFDAAARGGAVLLFDEADALFAKRTDVKSSNDRYANLEVNFLLQRLETFEGIAILTTNFLKNIDDAFRRRLRFIIEFTAPDADERRALWRALVPANAPLAADIPWQTLASLDLSGGSIRNATLRAAFAAAAREDEITGEDLLRAAVHELEAMGRLAPELSALTPQPERHEVPEQPDPEPVEDTPAEPAPPAAILRAGGLRPLIPRFPFPARKPA